MLYQEFINLTNLTNITFEDYTNNIEPKYMNSKQDKFQWCRQYKNSLSTMKKEYLKQIKDAINDFKGNRGFLNSLIKNKNKIYEEQISEYDPNNYIDSRVIERLIQQRDREIWELQESFGNDASIHIIYEDGSECCTNGVEIVIGDCTPKLQHIAYAHYSDGYQEIDTEIGELPWDISEDEELEARENYLNSIEIKYNTAWGIKHKNDIK